MHPLGMIPMGMPTYSDTPLTAKLSLEPLIFMLKPFLFEPQHDHLLKIKELQVDLIHLLNESSNPNFLVFIFILLIPALAVTIATIKFTKLTILVGRALFLKG